MTAESTPPKGIGPMAKREMKLAYVMLLPTFAIVLAIVMGPLLANFWISFKPVQLGDLRPASLIANERLRGDAEKAGDAVTIEYRIRNSSRDDVITGAGFTDMIPDGLAPTELDERCALTGQFLSCEIGDIEGGFRDRVRIEATVEPGYLENALNPRDSRPQITGSADNVLTNFEFSLENFRRVFSSSEFWHVFRVSMYYTIFGTAGALVLGLFAAQLLNTTFAGRGILRGLFLFPYVAPVIAVAFTWVVLLDPFSGTLNSILQQIGFIESPVNFFGERSVTINLFGLQFDFPVALSTVIAFEAWRYFPLSFLFILARMQSISTEMYEAAEIDGATPLQQFWYLSLPQLAGILAVLFLLRFIWTFNKFDDIFLLTGGAAGTRTLTVDVYEQAFAVSNLGAGAAVAVVVFIVLLTFSLLFFTFSPKDEA
ncbi:carbohydrate ABC transporter permease [Hoeflea poritis]|uniref:Sugar ABC transporter permease n=1 Tax=Hoeflea poritis TaxID=2993659 RepID=A0ABT4VHL2_9HYPH|nr:sugar ABC transporter permease [Hoeflea poritis]MDA4844197.1 sugar ABC transporter permease [Hoeflea poritis]